MYTGYPFRQLIGWGCILLMLASCASTPPDKPAEPPVNTDAIKAKQLYQQQAYQQAAPLYLALAKRHTGAEHQTFLLSGADAAFLSGDIRTTRAALESIVPTLLQQDERLLHELLQANLALADQQADKALEWLHSGQPTPDHNPRLRKRYYRTLANAYQHNHDFLLSAQALDQLLNLLDEPQQRLAQQIELLITLNQINALKLLYPPAPLPDTISGWVQLALLSRWRSDDLTSLQPTLDAWRQQFPDHPAMLNELMAHPYFQFAQSQTRAHIGVLLPETGRYAKASEAIRDGIMISLQQMPIEKRPVLSFYDSGNTQDIWPLYHQAIDDGAHFIIGPLQKSATTQLIRADALSAPVLALNTIQIDQTLPDNLYRYALDPENEARQVAERIWQDEKRQPIILAPKNAWGERLSNAFHERWLTLGGEAVDRQQYDPQSHDHSQAIVKLLHIHHSRARHAQLQRWLGQSLEFTPHRRTDVDAIFLVARERQAPAFSPQFQYHLAGDLPVYTTSHVWRGRINPQQLDDMRGITLPDIPLISTKEKQAELGQHIPGVQGGLVRLYAMGMDALDLVMHLPRLRHHPHTSMVGQTGNLYMDDTGQVQRQLVWLQLDDPIKTLGYISRSDEIAHTVAEAPPPENAVTPPPQTEPVIRQVDEPTTTR